MKYAVLLLLALIQVSLAIMLWYKKHSKVSQVFIIYAINMAAWTVANITLDYYQYNGAADIASLTTMNRAGFFIGVLSLIVVYYLSLVFPVQRERVPRDRFVLATGLVAPFLTLPSIVSGVFVAGETQSGVPEYVAGAGIYLIAAYVVLIAGLSVSNLLTAFRSANKEVRRQSVTIFSGLIMTIIAGVFFITISPIIVGDERFLFLGYYAPFIFTGSITYSIVRQKFLDFRMVVVRSLAYILTTATFAVLYVLLIFILASSFFGTGDLTGVQQVLYVSATLIFGFSLAPLKRFFDKITNRLFYRDSYDSQDLFDKLNKMLVGNVNLDLLLRQSADLIGSTLKAEFSGFVIDKTETAEQRVILSRKKNIDREEFESLGLGSKGGGKVLVVTVDELDERHSRAKDTLIKDGVAVITRLAVSDKTPVEIGYMIMGQKQSGNPYNRQDIQVLEIVANELVIAIQNALRFEEIEAFNVTLQQKVDDATKQLRITNEKLKALDETKDEFISMASHQLRTPLTAVKGYVSMVVEGDAGKLNKQQQELLNQAFSSSQRMVYLIADLLNVSRLKSGKFVIENKPTQLVDVVTSEIEQLTEVAKSKNQTLTFSKPENFPELMLDETKIRQVIMNFADNALHYTAAGGHIQISLEDKGDSVEYTVTDDGMGVPKHEQHHLFTKFFRAGNAKNARPDGTGLGLFMAKKVVIAQGGAVIFKSEEGKGSVFGFTFPKSRLAVPKH